MMHSDSEFVNLRDVIETLCYMVGEDSDGVEEVMQLPSIDIVRCSECKCWDRDYVPTYCHKHEHKTKHDDFCSYGKERASDEGCSAQTEREGE